MKAKLVRGSGFRGVLSYVFGDSKAAEIVGGTMSGTTPRGMAREFGAIRQRKDCKNPVWHASLSLPSGERLASEKWDQITAEFLQGLDFDPQKHLYTVVRHQDTDYDHVHIIACRIGLDGKIWHGQRDVLKAIKLTASLEKKHGLAITPTLDADNSPAAEKPLSGPEIQMGARQGEAPPRLVLQEAIREAIKGHPSASIFVQRLVAAGIGVRPALGKAGALSGFSFEFQGIAFKGSQLGKAYGWAGLQKQGVHYDQNRDLAPLSQVLAASHAPGRSQKKEDRRPEKTVGNTGSKNQEKTKMGGHKMAQEHDRDGLMQAAQAEDKRQKEGEEEARRQTAAAVAALRERLAKAKEELGLAKWADSVQPEIDAEAAVRALETQIIALQQPRLQAIDDGNGNGNGNGNDIGYEDVGLGPGGMSIEDAESLARKEAEAQAMDRLRKQAATATEASRKIAASRQQSQSVRSDVGQYDGIDGAPDDDDGEDVEYLAHLDRQWEEVKKRWANGDDGSRRNLSAEQKFKEDARRLSGARSLQAKLQVAKEIASRNFQKYYGYEGDNRSAFRAQLIADEEVAEIEAEIAAIQKPSLAAQAKAAAAVGQVNGFEAGDDDEAPKADRVPAVIQSKVAATVAAEVDTEIRRRWESDDVKMMADLTAKGFVSNVFWRGEEAYCAGPQGQKMKFAADHVSMDTPITPAAAALLADHSQGLGWKKTWVRGSSEENAFRLAAALEVRGRPYRLTGPTKGREIPPHYLEEARRYLATNDNIVANSLSPAPAPKPAPAAAIAPVPVAPEPTPIPKIVDPAPVAPPPVPPISKFTAPKKPTITEIDTGRAAIAKIGIDSTTLAAAERSGIINFSDGIPKMIGRDPTGRVASAVLITDDSGWRPKSHSDNAAAPILAGDPRTVWIATTPSEALAASALAVETGQSRPTVIMAGPTQSGQDWLTEDVKSLLAKADRVIVATTFSGHGDRQDKVEADSEKRREAIKTALADAEKPPQVLVYSPRGDSVMSDYKAAMAATTAPTMTAGVRR